MAKKVNLDQELKELRTKVLDGKAVIGTDRVIKLLKSKSLGKVFLASNCPSPVKDDIHYYARFGSVPVFELEQTNEELGIFCKKNFLVSVLATTAE